MNEPRTIEEQYTSAGNADDLTVTSERRTDADVERAIAAYEVLLSQGELEATHA